MNLKAKSMHKLLISQEPQFLYYETLRELHESKYIIDPITLMQLLEHKSIYLSYSSFLEYRNGRRRMVTYVGGGATISVSLLQELPLRIIYYFHSLSTPSYHDFRNCQALFPNIINNLPNTAKQ